MPSFADLLQQGASNAWLFVPGRIVAKVEDDRFIVLVLTVGHRREVYD